MEQMSAALPENSPLKASLQQNETPRVLLQPADRLFPLRNGAELFIDYPDAKAIPMEFGFSVVFGEQDVEGKLVLETIQDMFNLVESTVKNFEPLLN